MNENLTVNAPTPFDRLVYAMLPLGFVASSYTNIIAFALGLHRFDTVRIVFTFGLMGFAGILYLIKLFFIWRSRPETRRFMVQAALIIAAMAGIFLWAICIHTNWQMYLKNGITACIYLTLMYASGLIIVLENRIPAFLRDCKIYALVISPVLLFYCIRFYLPNADAEVLTLGALDYLTLGTGILTFCVFFLCDRIVHISDNGTPRRA